MIILFKAFSALLSYPTRDLQAALPEIAEIVRSSTLVKAAATNDILALIDELDKEGDILSVEERYVDLFDRGRALSLNLFEHLHGDSRDRGTAMVVLKQMYEKAGFELATPELPDYLPVVLEYLSQREINEARDWLADCGHILRAITEALIARQSHYAAITQALLVIAWQEPVDVARIEPVDESMELVDRDWSDKPAFSVGPASGSQGTQTGQTPVWR